MSEQKKVFPSDTRYHNKYNGIFFIWLQFSSCNGEELFSLRSNAVWYYFNQSPQWSFYSCSNIYVIRDDIHRGSTLLITSRALYLHQSATAYTRLHSGGGIIIFGHGRCSVWIVQCGRLRSGWHWPHPFIQTTIIISTTKTINHKYTLGRARNPLSVCCCRLGTPMHCNATRVVTPSHRVTRREGITDGRVLRMTVRALYEWANWSWGSYGREGVTGVRVLHKEIHVDSGKKSLLAVSH